MLLLQVLPADGKSCRILKTVLCPSRQVLVVVDLVFYTSSIGCKPLMFLSSNEVVAAYNTRTNIPIGGRFLFLAIPKYTSDKYSWLVWAFIFYMKMALPISDAHHQTSKISWPQPLVCLQVLDCRRQRYPHTSKGHTSSRPEVRKVAIRARITRSATRAKSNVLKLPHP